MSQSQENVNYSSHYVVVININQINKSKEVPWTHNVNYDLKKMLN